MLTLESINTEDANFKAIAFFKKTIAKAALEAATPFLSEEERQDFSHSIDHITQRSRLNPLLVALAAKNLALASDTQRAQQIKKAFTEIQKENHIKFNNFEHDETNSEVADIFLNLQKNILEAAGQNEFSYTKGSIVASEGVKQFTNAMKYLEANWNSCFLLTEALISEISFLKYNEFESGVTLNTFGTVFVNPLARWTFESYIEVLVHEMSHLQLMLHEQFEPYILNPEVVTESPIRSDRRPLSGVWHGTFALARMTEVFITLLMKPSGCGEDAFTRARHNLHRLNHGIDLLVNKGKFSSAGETLLSGLQSRANYFSEVLKRY